MVILNFFYNITFKFGPKTSVSIYKEEIYAFQAKIYYINFSSVCLKTAEISFKKMEI